MKKQFMSTNIFLQLYVCKAGLFKGNLFWLGQYDPTTFILEEELIHYQCYLIQFFSNLSKIISSQKAAEMILYMLTSLVFL